MSTPEPMSGEWLRKQLLENLDEAAEIAARVQREDPSRLHDMHKVIGRLGYARMYFLRYEQRQRDLTEALIGPAKEAA